MSRRPLSTPRRGFTLVELLLALGMTIAVFAMAVPFLRLQSRSVTMDAGRMDATLTSRFAQNTIDRDMRNMGIGVLDLQPTVVMAGARAITFNADLVSRDSGDARSVFYNPYADPALTGVLPATRKIALPGGAVQYPDSTYVDGAGANGPAETVSYWASLDSTAGRSDEYILFKRVNDGPITVLARGIQLPSGQPLFKYYRVRANGTMDSIPNASLPLYWKTAGQVTDSIRAVRMSLTGVYRTFKLATNDTITIRRTSEVRTALVNVGLANKTTCGDTPLSAGTLSLNLQWEPKPPPNPPFFQVSAVRLTWGRSVDEVSGERDVERYVIWRRVAGATTWEEPIGSVGKGRVTYDFDDFFTAPGTWQYAVAPQDCSPQNGPFSTATITIPVPTP